MDLVCARQLVSVGGSVPVCGFSVRSHGKTIRCYTGRELDNLGDDCGEYSAQHERVHWFVKALERRRPRPADRFDSWHGDRRCRCWHK